MSNATTVLSRLIVPADLAIIDAAVKPVTTLVPREGVFPGYADGVVALALPVMAYWSYSSIFHVMDVLKLAEGHRIHPTEEMLKKNRATQFEVVRDVIFQHIIQTITGILAFSLDTQEYTGYENSEIWTWRQVVPSIVPTWLLYITYWYLLSGARIFIAFVIIDTWQFTLHRFMHMHPFMYKHFHSRHHQLYVPYAYGALFNHPLEGFLLDTVGTGIASIVVKLSQRECIVLYTFSTLKTVDDHCGYSLPFDIFQRLFPNNSIYHDIHHQHFGIKYNFSQPFFTFWDSLLGSRFSGTDAYTDKNGRMTLDGYHKFLQDRLDKRRKVATEYHAEFHEISGSEDEDDSPKNPVNQKKNQ
ncbi:DEKNAAC104008 [Brettanomyces naardenensis]|uniref:DEKNAAC104008 n=1 Tax=Brettanomyces naardenensis TaxID=13370 RepID=A0A448YPU8_BRENA|nr:DEKNAAC104008 [Brettanomyces naardenensis]